MSVGLGNVVLGEGDSVRLRGYLPAIRGQWEGERMIVDDATLAFHRLLANHPLRT